MAPEGLDMRHPVWHDQYVKTLVASRADGFKSFNFKFSWST